MEVLWTAPAQGDLLSQIEYLLEHNPDAARRARDAIQVAAELLAEYPHRGRPGRNEGTRELVVTGFPYIIVYRVREATIRMLRVLHGSQNWPPDNLPSP